MCVCPKPETEFPILCAMVFFFCIQGFQMRGGCLFCWYWLNCWTLLFKLSFHKDCSLLFHSFYIIINFHGLIENKLFTVFIVCLFVQYIFHGSLQHPKTESIGMKCLKKIKGKTPKLLIIIYKISLLSITLSFT